MTAERVARRYPASAVPTIKGVRLTPPDAAATLVNVSATGVLVACATRPQLGGTLTVHFAGTFTPASIEARVVRCQVAGISPEGSLRYHIGLAFSERISLPNDADDGEHAEAAAVSVPTVVAAGASPVDAPAPSPILRNRW